MKWLLLFLCACAEDLRPDPKADGGGMALPPGSFITEAAPDGTRVSIVDASSIEDWLYVDFETMSKVDETAAWDLRFQRFHISTNGGISGTGGVDVATLADTSLSSVREAPADGYVTDAVDGDDANMEPDYAFEQGAGWYDYDAMAHVLTPFPNTYVVHTNGGSTIALAIQSYYDAAGTAGWFTFQWKQL